MVGQYDRADDILVNHGNGRGTCVTSGIEMTLRLVETMRIWSCHYTDVLPLSPLPRSTYGVRSMCPKIIVFKVAAPPKAHSSDQEPMGRSQCIRRAGRTQCCHKVAAHKAPTSTAPKVLDHKCLAMRFASRHRRPPGRARHPCKPSDHAVMLRTPYRILYRCPSQPATKAQFSSRAPFGPSRQVIMACPA